MALSPRCSRHPQGKEDVQGRKATWGLRLQLLRPDCRKSRCRTRGGRNPRVSSSHWPLRCSRGAEHGTETSAPLQLVVLENEKRYFTACMLRRERESTTLRYQASPAARELRHRTGSAGADAPPSREIGRLGSSAVSAGAPPACSQLPHAGGRREACHDYANNLADYVFSIALSFFALGVFVMELYGCSQ
jgi:hypothetical protein